MKGVLGAVIALGLSLAAFAGARADDLPRLIIDYSEPTGSDPSIAAAHDVQTCAWRLSRTGSHSLGSERLV